MRVGIAPDQGGFGLKEDLRGRLAKANDRLPIAVRLADCCSARYKRQSWQQGFPSLMHQGARTLETRVNLAIALLDVIEAFRVCG